MIIDELILNRSYPIVTTIPTFERFHRDPRPISGDLRQVYLGEGPQRMLYYWQRLLEIWGISPNIQIKYQFILTTYPGAFDIYDYQSAKDWIQEEDDDWTGKWLIDNKLGPGLWGNIWATRKWPNGDVGQHFVGALHEKYRDEDLSKAVKPAFGFWMFPIDLGVFGKVPSSEEELRVQNTQQLVDMSGHWPGLGLYSLS